MVRWEETSKKARSNPPFTEIAPYYDIIMDDVEYMRWVDYLEEIFKARKMRPRRILDLACGTGPVALILKKRDYEVFGVDLSPEMLEVARGKDKEGEIRFLEADMRSFDLGETFDVVICLFDSVNNLLREEDLEATFNQVMSHLNEGGLFVFDLNTVYCLAYYWDDRTRVRENRGIVSIWRTSYDQKKTISRLDLSLFVPDGECYRRIDETHFERGYSLETVDRMLKRAGFRKRYFFEHLTFRKPRSTTLRVMAIAEKGGSRVCG